MLLQDMSRIKRGASGSARRAEAMHGLEMGYIVIVLLEWVNFDPRGKAYQPVMVLAAARKYLG